MCLVVGVNQDDPVTSIGPSAVGSSPNGSPNWTRIDSDDPRPIDDEETQDFARLVQRGAAIADEECR